MRKTILFIGTWLFIIGTLRLIAPHSLTQFMALDPAVAWLSIGTAVLAFANGSRWFSLLDLRFIFRALGMTLLIIAIYGVNSPTFGDMRQTYVPVADLFLALESGIIMLLLAAEKSAEALSPLVYLSLIGTYFYRRLGARLSTASTLSRRKSV